MPLVDPRAPDPGELEISIFGTGKGESIVIHLGGGHWGIVDACRDPVTNDSVPLAYLKDIGISPTAVEFVMATHWHDDHVDGLAETLSECAEAEFAASMAYTGEEFRAVTLEAASLDVSRVEEMINCFTIVEGRPRRYGTKQTVNRVLEDTRIWWNQSETVDLTAIAPTNLALDRANQDIADKLLPNVRRRRSLGRITPNQASVAAILRTPAGCVLLGGDVEERGAGGSGWAAIVGRQLQRGRPRSELIKIPHHGSDNAHHAGQWTELTTPKPLSVVTPFASSRRPRVADVRRLVGLSEAVYICGSGAEVSASVEPRVSRAAAADGVTITKTGKLGQVRFRKELAESAGALWKVEMGGAAMVADDTDTFVNVPRTRGTGQSSVRRRPR